MSKSGLADSPFFQRDAPLPPAPPAEEKAPPVVEHASAPGPALDTPSEPAQPTAPVDASMHARKHANMQASIQTSMHANMQPYLSEKATHSCAFRYPPALLEKLTDLLHDIRKQHRRKLTKNAVAVVALAFLLTDFETYGEESVLYQLLIQTDE